MLSLDWLSNRNRYWLHIPSDNTCYRLRYPNPPVGTFYHADRTLGGRCANAPGGDYPPPLDGSYHKKHPDFEWTGKGWNEGPDVCFGDMPVGCTIQSQCSEEACLYGALTGEAIR